MQSVVQCNKCNERFFLQDGSLKSVKKIQRGQEIELTYFACEHCNEVYPVLWADDRLREMREQYVKESDKIKEVLKSGGNVTPLRVQRLKAISENISKRAESLSKYYEHKIPEYITG